MKFSDPRRYAAGPRLPFGKTLRALGITQWGDFLNYSEKELLHKRGCGPKRVAVIKARLARKGLAFKDSPIEKEEPENSHVYFMRCGEFVKIGFSSEAVVRIQAIEACTPYPVEVLALLALTRKKACKYENELHMRFSDLRHRGEWFRYTGALREFIFLARSIS